MPRRVPHQSIQAGRPRQQLNPFPRGEGGDGFGNDLGERRLVFGGGTRPLRTGIGENALFSEGLSIELASNRRNTPRILIPRGGNTADLPESKVGEDTVGLESSVTILVTGSITDPEVTSRCKGSSVVPNRLTATPVPTWNGGLPHAICQSACRLPYLAELASRRPRTEDLKKKDALMPRDWKTAFKILQDEFAIVANEHIESYHGLIHINGSPHPETECTLPRFYASGGRALVHRIGIPLSNGGSHLHFFFNDSYEGTNTAGLVQFQRRLSRIRRLLSDLPAGVLPRFHVPALENSLDESTIRWVYILYYMALKMEKGYLNAEIEFAYSQEDIEQERSLMPWEEFSAAADFDPTHLLTLTGPSEQNVDFWRDAHVNAGRRFPDVIAASLTKSLPRASWNAIDLLLNQTDALADEHTGTRRIRRRRKPAKDGGLTDDQEIVLGVLRKHHFVADKEQAYKPLKQCEILKSIAENVKNTAGKDKDTNWNPTRVVRAMKNMGPIKGAKVYRALCRSGRIVEVLIRLSGEGRLPRTSRLARDPEEPSEES